MKDKTICFTGHRIIPSDEIQLVTSTLRETLISCIEEGYCFFYAGGALGFDTLAAQIVIDLKPKYPNINLILVLPCHEQTKGWNEKDIKTYYNIMKNADKIVYTSEHYYRGCMHVRNRYLVDSSSLCICLLTKKSGGTLYTVEYARDCKIPVINIGDLFEKKACK